MLHPRLDTKLAVLLVLDVIEKNGPPPLPRSSKRDYIYAVLKMKASHSTICLTKYMCATLYIIFNSL